MHKKAMLAVAATVVMLFVAMTVQRHGIETQLTVYGQRYENAERDLEDEKNRTGEIDGQNTTYPWVCGILTICVRRIND